MEYRREEAKRAERRLARRRATEARYLVEGVMLFALGEFVFQALSVERLLVLTVPGLALGWTCAKLKVGPTGFTIAAAVGYAVVYGVFGFFAFWHFLYFVVFGSVAGLMHALQRADGSEGM